MTDATNYDPLTNADRAERLHQVLKEYGDGWSVETIFIDLLADARHWCDTHGLCYGDLDRIAHKHYLVELGEERGWK